MCFKKGRHEGTRLCHVSYTRDKLAEGEDVLTSVLKKIVTTAVIEAEGRKQLCVTSQKRVEQK